MYATVAEDIGEGKRRDATLASVARCRSGHDAGKGARLEAIAGRQEIGR